MSDFTIRHYAVLATLAQERRRLTARRGVGAQESYVTWCDEAIAAAGSSGERG